MISMPQPSKSRTLRGFRKRIGPVLAGDLGEAVVFFGAKRPQRAERVGEGGVLPIHEE